MGVIKMEHTTGKDLADQMKEMMRRISDETLQLLDESRSKIEETRELTEKSIVSGEREFIKQQLLIVDQWRELIKATRKEMQPARVLGRVKYYLVVTSILNWAILFMLVL